ncbi:MAG: radical SAM protein [Acutalibacteraceae bacterium]
MNIQSKNEVLEILSMPQETFEKEIIPQAQKVSKDALSENLLVTSMMGYSNICKNNCLYCGMRAKNNSINRFRIDPENVINACVDAKNNGFRRTFLISGEDQKYGFENILKIVSKLKEENIFVSLACGEFEKSQFDELKDAGVDEYVLKFEMSNPQSFNYLNPSTNFEKRMESIEYIKSIGMRLASGNIVDWPGQSADELADDILLMKKLDISWAPIIPYLPALNTPLAEKKKRGDLLTLYKEIAILRLMMPRVNITAQQPGVDMTKGLSDSEGNIAAINAGANVLFFDLLSDADAKSFRVIDDRNITGPAHIFNIANATGRKLILE